MPQQEAQLPVTQQLNTTLKPLIHTHKQRTVTDLIKVLRPSQPIRVLSSMVSLPNHTFPGQV